LCREDKESLKFFNMLYRRWYNPESAIRDGVSARLCRRTCQTAPRCKGRKTAVVNGWRKGGTTVRC